MNAIVQMRSMRKPRGLREAGTISGELREARRRKSVFFIEAPAQSSWFRVA
jgi:hypothetical protein